MTIASKLFYYHYQRSRTTRTCEPELEPETRFGSYSPDRDRRGHLHLGGSHDESHRRELSGRHPHGKNPFRPVSKKEPERGDCSFAMSHMSRRNRVIRQRDHKLEFGLVDHRGTSKCEPSEGNNTKTSNRKVVGSRLTKDAAFDQLPDAVKQARQRLLQRLQGVTPTGFRQTPDKFCSSTDLKVVSSKDCESSSLRECFASGSDTTRSLCDLRIKPSVLCWEAAARVQQKIHENSVESDGVELSIECCICLERLVDGDGLIQLKCRHTFHSGCLERWVQSHGDCPYCRANVV